MSVTRLNLNGIHELDLGMDGTTTATITSPGVVTVQNTPSVSSGIQFVDNARSGSAIEGIVGAYPTVPFTVTLLMQNPSPANDYAGAGITVASSLTGNAMWFGMLHYSGFSPQWALVVYTYTNPNSSGSGLAFTNTGSNSGTSIWLRLQDDGTNLTFSSSANGSSFTTIYTVAKASSYLASSGFNYLGYVIQPQLAAVTSVLEDWTITNP